jgi:ABC-type Fe3+-citrate transport system substrate-binding protein
MKVVVMVIVAASCGNSSDNSTMKSSTLEKHKHVTVEEEAHAF